MSDDVGERLKNNLLGKVGKKAVGDGECFALVDEALKTVGAKSAEDFGTVTEDADYVWGNKVALSDVRPGDVLQFWKHVVTVRTDTKTETRSSWREDTYSRGRPNHTVVALSGEMSSPCANPAGSSSPGLPG